jgi:Rrf2 family transcriptional regulator, iron-sulfur cluster assembly transcription factor
MIAARHMRISRKAEYALRALTVMARKPPAATSQIEDLAAAGHIPVKFLEQILLILKRAGLLRSRRGVGGGYQLDRAPDRITLAEVLTAVDGIFQPTNCTQPDPALAGRSQCECGVTGGCGMGRLFTDLQKQVNTFLQNTTLADAVAREGSTPAMHFDI